MAPELVVTLIEQEGGGGERGGRLKRRFGRKREVRIEGRRGSRL